ncbi:hypothetical protein [Pseudoramibacter faecis]|uniref:hypothetical protein n=1 Tax=Pseudoramibacter faecis TaxID=3108534 RepID=UPI002E7A631C|nr:hypothetical protein [Pseudoramibacter sp. HA2172]
MRPAIRSWLPLYMSGMMEPFSTPSFYVRALPQLRLAMWQAARDGSLSLPRGGVKPRIRRTGLLRAVRPSETINVYRRDGGVSDAESGVTVIQSGPSLATMPEDLPASFGSETLMAAWRKQQKHYAHWLQEGYVCEYWPRASDAAVAAGQIRGGAAPSELIVYTPSQYEAHLRHLKALPKAHANYYLYILPALPLRR